MASHPVRRGRTGVHSCARPPRAAAPTALPCARSRRKRGLAGRRRRRRRPRGPARAPDPQGGGRALVVPHAQPRSGAHSRCVEPGLLPPLLLPLPPLPPALAGLCPGQQRGAPRLRPAPLTARASRRPVPHRLLQHRPAGRVQPHPAALRGEGRGRGQGERGAVGGRAAAARACASRPRARHARRPSSPRRLAFQLPALPPSAAPRRGPDAHLRGDVRRAAPARGAVRAGGPAAPGALRRAPACLPGPTCEPPEAALEGGAAWRRPLAGLPEPRRRCRPRHSALPVLPLARRAGARGGGARGRAGGGRERAALLHAARGGRHRPGPHRVQHPGGWAGGWHEAAGRVLAPGARSVQECLGVRGERACRPSCSLPPCRPSRSSVADPRLAARPNLARAQPWGTPLQAGAGSSGLDPAGPAAQAQAQAAAAAAQAGGSSGGSSPVVPSPEGSSGGSDDSRAANGGGEGLQAAKVRAGRSGVHARARAPACVGS